MHPPTVITMLAVHLIGMGLLFLYASKRLPDQQLLWPWAIASLSMGSAYVARLVIGLGELPPSSVWIDTLMVLALLLYIVGVRELLGHERRLRPVLAAAAGFLVVQAAVTYGVSATARFALLYCVLGVLYLVMGGVATHGTRGLDRASAMRWPLGTFGVLIVVLGALSLVRGVVVAREGAATMYQGWTAAVYFAYGSVVVVLLAVIVVWNVFARMSDALHRLARHDPLTGALNRHGLEEALQRHFAQPGAPAMALLAFDIDHFKRINDGHGHATGDTVLRAVVRSLLAHCRSDDIVARTGGEEFLVAHATDDAARAAALAERLRESVAAVRVRGRLEDEIHCTVSVGVSAAFGALGDWERAAGEADAALYAAKANGRNRCERFEPLLARPPASPGERLAHHPSTLASVSSASSSIQSTTDRQTSPTTLSR
jgi:diguanylate cyclase (GGDEF)-like protein